MMVACLSPADNNYDETLSTLRYANRAKNIKNKPKINEDPKDALLRQYQEEIEKLKAMLSGQIPMDAAGRISFLPFNLALFTPFLPPSLSHSVFFFLSISLYPPSLHLSRSLFFSLSLPLIPFFLSLSTPHALLPLFLTLSFSFFTSLSIFLCSLFFYLSTSLPIHLSPWKFLTDLSFYFPDTNNY